MTTDNAKRRALIIISSARRLPLSEPASMPSIPTGFFLVELAQVLREFENDYEFTLATPDGQAPQLDTNGLALAWHATTRMEEAATNTAAEVADPGFTVDAYRRNHADLVERRERELELMQRHLGRLPVTEPLPSTDREALAVRTELLQRSESWPTQPYVSVQDLVYRHRDPADDFTLAGFDFIYAPGGHAPMVDFRDNPWLGEALHLARENNVLISLICHAPVSMTSTALRVDDNGTPYRVEDNPFLVADVTTVGSAGETGMLDGGYVHIPGERTRLTYFVDEALQAAGFTVQTTPNPFSLLLLQNPDVALMTGNGPQVVDEQATAVRAALANRA